jgi:hypothetical protein
MLASLIAGVPSSQIYQSGQAVKFLKTIVKQMLDNCQDEGDGKSTPTASGEFDRPRRRTLSEAE